MVGPTTKGVPNTATAGNPLEELQKIPAAELDNMFIENRKGTIRLREGYEEIFEKFLAAEAYLNPPERYLPAQFREYGEAIRENHMARDDYQARDLDNCIQKLQTSEKALSEFQEGQNLSIKQRLLYSIPFLGNRFRSQDQEVLEDRVSLDSLYYQIALKRIQSDEAEYAKKVQNRFSSQEFTLKPGDTHIDPAVLLAAIPLEKKSTLFAFSELKEQAQPELERSTPMSGDCSFVIGHTSGSALYIERRADGKVAIFSSPDSTCSKRALLGEAWNDDALELINRFKQRGDIDETLLNRSYEKMFIPRLDFYQNKQMAWIEPWLYPKPRAQ
jgi:hypothetical protein